MPPWFRRLAGFWHYMRMEAHNPHRLPELPEEHVDLAVEVFRMLADATRVRLLWHLMDGELSVGELVEATGKSQTGVSQHLAKLRMARLVQTRRQGTSMFYRLESDHVRQLLQDAIFHAEHAGTEVPEHHRADPEVTVFANITTRRRLG
jgi:DNA-binding transcriptional ArsR family regulator